MQDLGHSVILVTIFKGDTELPFSGPIIHLNRPLSKRLWDLKGWKHLAQIIKKENPDVVQANAGDTLKYLIFSKLLFRWHKPVILRNASTLSLYIKTLPIKLFNQLLYRHVDLIVSVSEQSRRDAINIFPVVSSKSLVIPIGTEVNKSVDAVTRDQSQSVLVHIGGFTFEKNHLGLLSIFERILKKKSDIKLWLIGDGPLRESVQQVAKKKNIIDNIIFFGSITNPLDYITAADALVLPSIIEGLPGVILEAFYCETPVIASKIGGVPEIVEHENTGLLVEAENYDQFATQVLRILDPKNVSLRNKIARNARERVMKKFDNRDIASRFINAYKQAIFK